MYLKYMSIEGAENKRYNAVECKQVRRQVESLSPIGREAPPD